MSDWVTRWREAEDTRGQEGGLFATYDAIGRKNPRRLGHADYLLLIARSDPARVRRVPSIAVVEEGEDDQGPFAFITCPCGTRPVARTALAKCGGCDRNYVRFEQGTVFVAYAGEIPALVNLRENRDDDGEVAGDRGENRDEESSP